MTSSILIVDDEPEIRMELAEYFNIKGYAIQIAGDGREALEKFKAIRPQAVITDLVMPRMRGEKLVAEIRKIDPDVLIVVATGHYSQSDMEAATAAGADTVVRKPVQLRQLYEMMKDRLTRDEGDSS